MGLNGPLEPIHQPGNRLPEGVGDIKKPPLHLVLHARAGLAQLRGAPQQGHPRIKDRAIRSRGQVVEVEAVQQLLDLVDVVALGAAAGLGGVGGKGQMQPQPGEQIDGLVIAQPLLFERADQGQKRLPPGGPRGAVFLTFPIDPHAVALLGQVDQVKVGRKGPDHVLSLGQRETPHDLEELLPGLEGVALPQAFGQLAHLFFQFEDARPGKCADGLSQSPTQHVYFAFELFEQPFLVHPAIV